MTRISTAIMVGVCLGFATPVPASAQKPPETADTARQPAPPKLDPKACADDKRATTGSGGDTLEAPNPDQTLSQSLAQTDGVICPPADVDPDIHMAPPGGGAMKIIPPPGGPGGDPSVRPR